MEIFLFVLGVIGMTHIVVDATIFQWLRDLIDAKLPEKVSKLIHCYQCTGFWCGLFCGWAAFSGITIPQIFLAGCAGSILSNFTALYMNYLEAITVISIPPEKE
jgi:hypothetical protein